MRYVIIGLMIASLLTACGREISKFETVTFPDVVVYSLNVQKKAAVELETYDVPTLAEFMKDYKVMRDQVRVARGEAVCPQPAGSRLKCN